MWEAVASILCHGGEDARGGAQVDEATGDGACGLWLISVTPLHSVCSSLLRWLFETARAAASPQSRGSRKVLIIRRRIANSGLSVCLLWWRKSRRTLSHMSGRARFYKRRLIIITSIWAWNSCFHSWPAMEDVVDLSDYCYSEIRNSWMIQHQTVCHNPTDMF